MRFGLFAAIFACLSAFANAQTSTSSTLKVDEIVKNRKFEEDKEITDSRLKADSGSLSRYSLKFALSYFGPPIGDMTNKYQPNPDGSLGVYSTSLGGSISGRYRIDSKSAISVGTGVSALTPFHGVERIDVKTPFISYDKNSRLGSFQMRNSYGFSVTTVPNFRDVGQYSSLSYDNSLIYNFGTSGLAAGLDTGANVFLYERDYIKKDGKASRWVIGFYPQIKYNINDKTNIYTSVAMNFWNPRFRSSEADLWNKTITGRLGMGTAFSRDIYFAPYLNFYPDNPRAETTTVSFSTIFSIL